MTGNNEDSATAVAAGALASILQQDLRIEQGRLLGHPSLIYVNYHSPQELWVGGYARRLS